MDREAARTARDSLELAFQISNILETGLDRHTLSILIALCDAESTSNPRRSRLASPPIRPSDVSFN
ncbi:hypothetical protein Leryth_007924 [Lithospermum erythrorhizon]|nr:hypothetical protein Leryth_007924 [Lithospermum erythrorhizon]